VQVVTYDDSADARSEVHALAQLPQTTVLEDGRNAGSLLADLAVDRILVAGWYWRIPPSVTDRELAIGIHHSLLPKYRGGSPLVWALINGDPVGTSLFTLSGQMDAGPLWGQRRVEAGEGYIGDVVEACNAAALELLPVLLDPAARPVAQNEADASWCAARTADDGLIDWREPAQAISRRIRAQSRPYPGAYTYSRTDRVRIWRASPLSITYYGEPGTVVGDFVVCGDNHPIRIEEADGPLSGRLGNNAGPMGHA
jgi:methionyl-tRNA formyltransferase